jgi:peptidyl-prolyl cis-trans isomerase C
VMKATGFWRAMAAAMLLASAAPALAEDMTADTVVATVNGANITLGQMIVLRGTLSDQYQALPDDVLYKGILEQLVQQAVLEQSLGDKITKRDQIAVENNTRGYLSGIALQAVIKSAVTDEALQAAYDARFKDAAPQTEYHAQHILVADEAKAKDLKAQLDAGADFAELAKANSTDTGSGANGGDLGWFGLGAMVKPFEDAVVAAKVGEVTAPVKSDFGWHLIKVTETRIAAAPPLDELRDQLASEIEQKAIEAHLKTLTDAATITKPGEKFDPKLLRDETLVDK